MLVRRRQEQELGGVRGAASERDEVARVRLPLAVVLDDDARDLRAVVVRFQLDGPGVREELDVRMLERRLYPEHLGVGLTVHGAGEAVAVGAAGARAVG